ncbi:MAG TPA: hypothetical protein VED84_01210, partial [Acidimicrobiales bacterium]|nr:hypothetical protein [Acidimicrobiales bacterium]
AGIAATAGFLLTFVLPEPARRTLEAVSGEDAADGVPLAAHAWSEDASRRSPSPGELVTET